MFDVLETMTNDIAKIISQWKYEGEYSIYSFQETEEMMNELLNQDYFPCLNQEKEVIGYFCKGHSAIIPTLENYDYDDGFLDIGLGMAPKLCNHGYGYDFMACGLIFMKQKYGDVPMRLSVACFNHRAINLYLKHGFVKVKKVTHKNSHQPFWIMIRQ
ncbi:MAG: GNAT family N-acetyltransferase [Longibaculum sp.]